MILASENHHKYTDIKLKLLNHAYVLNSTFLFCQKVGYISCFDFDVCNWNAGSKNKICC